MKIIIEVKTNGIHDYALVDLSQPTTELIPFIRQIIEVVEAYNKSQIDKA